MDAEAVDPLDDFGSLNGGVLTTYIDGGVVCTISYGVGGRCEGLAPFENFPVGTHTTYVSYSGNDYYAPSTSPLYDVVIVADPTATTVTSSLNPSTFGQAVTFTAVIADQYHVAEGTVNFLDGTTVIGTGTVDGAGHGHLHHLDAGDRQPPDQCDLRSQLGQLHRIGRRAAPADGPGS